MYFGIDNLQKDESDGIAESHWKDIEKKYKKEGGVDRRLYLRLET